MESSDMSDAIDTLRQEALRVHREKELLQLTRIADGLASQIVSLEKMVHWMTKMTELVEKYAKQPVYMSADGVTEIAPGEFGPIRMQPQFTPPEQTEEKEGETDVENVGGDDEGAES